MPRHRYTQAYIRSPKLRVPIVEVKRISEGVAVLEALGVGCLCLESPEIAGCITVELDLGILSGKGPEALWKRVDAERDIAYARTIPLDGRQVNPSNRGIWPGCTPDIERQLRTLKEESCLRLRHFGALSIAGIRINDYNYVVQPRERLAKDAELTEDEKRIAFQAARHSAYRDLLWLS